MINLTEIGRVTSGYGLRAQPTKGASTNHKGVDIVLNNPSIPAVMGGTVSFVGYSSTGGNMITIEQSDGTTATYMHMLSSSPLKVGQTVTEGQTVGIMGSTGVSTGAHVHYQVKDANGNFIDPVSYMDGGGGSVSVSNEESGGLFSGLKNSALGIVGNIITVVAVLLLCILAVYLFMKAFDIKIM